MKRTIAILCASISFIACNRHINVDIEGHLIDNAASMIYLVVENDAIDTLASVPIADDNSFRLRCKVEQPTVAFLCDDNGNAISMLLTESEALTLRPSDKGGYMVEGGPINDKYNVTMRQLSDLAQQIMNINQNSETAAEEYESLMAKYHEALSTAITYNLDNIIGVELFIQQESRSMTPDDMSVRFAQFTPQMQKLKQMQQFKHYIEILQRSQIGQPFIDAEVMTITGEMTHLSDICGKGKWVLLDFWATWCGPCLEEMPQLKKAYASYALMGLEICGISLDPDIDRLRNYVAQEGLLWKNMIDLPKEGATSIAEIYGVTAIPTNFLISPDGKIVARDLRGEDLIHQLQHFIEGEEFCAYPQLHSNQHVGKTPEK